MNKSVSMKSPEEILPGFENVDKENFYEDFSKVHIEAIFKDGMFFDQADQKPVKLSENSQIRVIAYKKDVLKEQQIKFVTQTRTILFADTKFIFRLQGTELFFECQLREDLVFIKDGNKLSKALPARIIVTPSSSSPTKYFDPFEVYSLNQAYFAISTMFKENARSHTTNVYLNFHVIGGKPLEEYRF